jgi:hypothetical protein
MAAVTVEEAIKNAVELLESLGYVGGEIHDDLVQVMDVLDSHTLDKKLPE